MPWKSTVVVHSQLSWSIIISKRFLERAVKIVRYDPKVTVGRSVRKRESGIHEFAARNAENPIADTGAKYRFVGGKRIVDALRGRKCFTMSRRDAPCASSGNRAALLPVRRGICSHSFLRPSALLQPE